jgi:hypothetical protein
MIAPALNSIPPDGKPDLRAPRSINHEQNAEYHPDQPLVRDRTKTSDCLMDKDRESRRAEYVLDDLADV